ncbi:DUF302 domain-containing protein [Aliiroseovarius sp. YM-037]|uniref:DUF302 domain-containing protein n=1 Tax=Aliiroseovarius sp. YM-037 TaxID=3341728 RepID=UPI003A80074A
MKNLIAPLAALLIATPALADDIVRTETEKTVAEATDALVETITGAGATVFARVNHGAGAESIGSDVGASELLIFGNPAIGTPAIMDNRLAGLHLPLKILVYEDTDGQVWMAYETPEETLDDLDGISGDAEYLGKMAGALNNFVTKAQ